MKHHLLAAVESSPERRALCQTLNLYLSDQINILEAGSGSEALDLYSQYQPSIAILDIEMKDITGLEVAEQIRKSQKSCAFLFLADSDNFSDARQAIALRALDFLVKPYDEKKLVSSLREALHYVSHFDTPLWDPGFSHSGSPASLSTDQESARLSLVREDIRSFIDENYMKELSMKNAARALNYSDAYFCKLFKQCFQVNMTLIV